jgi:ParB family chromosome partitioning protein
MFKNIEVEKITPHPHNPRGDLGDLTELTESLKINGVLQNLTVVPWFSKVTGKGADDPKKQEEMGYIVVIGHRRLAAAKAAGLAEVPCAISTMGLRDQIATMLLENIQRTDLTVYEQAQGFQLMLDLGETVKGVSEKTGFSETTIRKRTDLLSLDPEKFRESMSRGATLMDYAKLNEIENVETRNAVLDKIGTVNFGWDLRQAIEKEKNDKEKAAMIAVVERFATQTDNVLNLRFVEIYANAADIDTPKDLDVAEYFFVVSKYGKNISLYTRSATEKEAEAEAEKAAKARKKEAHERKEALLALVKTAYVLRREFVRGISAAKAKKNIEVVMRYMISDVLSGVAFSWSVLRDIINTENESSESLANDFRDSYANRPELGLLVAVYCMLDAPDIFPFDWGCAYAENEFLKAVYAFLRELGYEPSDEERALIDGTHELYVKDGE